MLKLGIQKDRQQDELFHRLLRRNIVLPLTLVVVLAGVFISQISYLILIGRWVVRPNQAIAQAHRVLGLYVDSETGLRGYLLTEQPVFLEPLRQAAPLIPIEESRLHSLISEYPAQNRLFDQISARFSEWRVSSREYLVPDYFASARLSRGFAPGSNHFVSSNLEAHRRGLMERKMMMDAIRSRMGALIAEEERLRDEKSERTEHIIWALMLFTLLISLVAGGWLALAGRSQLLTLSQAYRKALDDLRSSHQDLEDRVESRTRELTLANKELEAFSYSVSHDLRAPLRGIDGFSLALIEDYSSKLDETGNQYLTFVRQGVQKMGKLIDEMLTLSRLTRAELTPQKVDLSALARRIADNLRASQPERDAEFVIQENLITFGDPVLLEAALENLLSNSWKFTGKTPHARIEFGVSPFKASDSKKAPEGLNTPGGPDEKTHYFVKDNGAGFDMAYADKLFGAFQRLHSSNDFHGTGVGLASVKRIIARHGGQVWGEGRPGQGAIFYFTLGDAK